MSLGWRRFVLVGVVAASAIAVLLPGGSAADPGGTAAERAVDFTFEVVPGPGEVTYGENIAYKAEISNTSGTMLTHVIFRMRTPFVGSIDDPVPAAQSPNSTCPQNGGQGVTVTNADGTVEWTCDFGNLPAFTGDPAEKAQTTLSVVWQVLPSTSLVDCPNCLQTSARVTVKEGLNDQTNLNDAFLPKNEQSPATLLAADSDDSQNTKSAGGYETAACTPASGQASLLTKQKLDPVANKVSTELCITQIPTSPTNLGLAATISEGLSHPGNPGFPELETSDVCIAAPGANCGLFGQYTPQVFDPAHPIIVVLRIPDDALDAGHKIRNVWHNYDALTNPDPLPLCGTNPVPLNGCLDGPPTQSKGRVKIWTIVVKTLTNGWFGGG